MKTELQHGWFVGYIERGDRAITFAYHIADDGKYDTFVGPRAKEETWVKLRFLIMGDLDQ
jgi:beta-lactamase class D